MTEQNILNFKDRLKLYAGIGIMGLALGFAGGEKLGNYYETPRAVYETKVDNRDFLTIESRNGTKIPFARTGDSSFKRLEDVNEEVLQRVLDSTKYLDEKEKAKVGHLW